MNTKELQEWCKERLECEYQFSSLMEEEACKAVLELIHELEATQKALEDLAEMNYNLTHSPVTAYAKLLKKTNELEHTLKQTCPKCGGHLDYFESIKIGEQTFTNIDICEHCGSKMDELNKNDFNILFHCQKCGLQHIPYKENE